MKISSVNRINQEAERANAFQPSDSESKEVQNQISSAQKKLKELASDHQLNEEEKAKKRKEIQQQIAELNKQLKQHQMELRREKEKEKASNVPEEEEEKRSFEEEAGAKGAAQNGIKAIISANSAISHAKAQGNLALSMEGRVRVLQSEISQDERYGKDTGQKQRELKKLEQKAVKVKGAKMSYLSKAAREMRESAAQERQTDKKSGSKRENISVNPASPLRSPAKSRTDIYIKGNMFSNVDFHF